MPLSGTWMLERAPAPTRGWQPVGVSTGEARLLPWVRLIEATARHGRRLLLRVVRERDFLGEIGIFGRHHCGH